MTDIQILTIALTLAVTFIGVLTGVLINNNRLNDVKDLLRAEIKAVEVSSTAQAETLRAEMQSFRSELIMLMKRHHAEVMQRFTETDARISRLENERRLVS